MIGSRIVRWMTVLEIAVASGPPPAAWAGTQPVATIKVPAPQAGQPRKVVIVRGVELSGTLVMRYEHGCAYLNELEWLSTPTPYGFMTPKPTFDAGELSPAAVRMFQSVPRVVQLQRQGLSRNRAIEIYFAQQESLLDHVSDVYRKALPSGSDAADRAARLAIDPGLASVDTAGPHAPSFSGSGSVTLYFHGLGLRGLDRLHAAGSAAARRDVARSLKTLPVNVAVELEQAHAFDHDPTR
jgi:hypothetical protein